MSQITLYLDDSPQALVDQASAANGMSRSRWVAEIIRKYAAHEWSKECVELAGRLVDFPLQCEISDSSRPADVPCLGF